MWITCAAHLFVNAATVPLYILFSFKYCNISAVSIERVGYNGPAYGKRDEEFCAGNFLQPFLEAYKSGYLKKFSKYEDQHKETGSNCFLKKKKWSVRQTFTFRDLCVTHKQCLGITLLKVVLSIVVLPSVADKYEDLKELCSST